MIIINNKKLLIISHVIAHLKRDERKGVKKREMNEILELIDSLSGSITSIEVSKQLKINQKEVDKVLLWLIDNDKVIDLSSKRGVEIGKKIGVDYSLLSDGSSLSVHAKKSKYKLKNKHINTAIGIIGALIGLWIAYLQGLFDSFLNIV